MNAAVPCCPLCSAPLPDDGLFISEPHGLVVRRNGKAELSPTEMKIFLLLNARKPHVVVTAAIMERLYGEREQKPLEECVDVFICKLRRKLKPLGLDISHHRPRGFSLTITEDATCRF